MIRQQPLIVTFSRFSRVHVKILSVFRGLQTHFLPVTRRKHCSRQKSVPGPHSEERSHTENNSPDFRAPSAERAAALPGTPGQADPGQAGPCGGPSAAIHRPPASALPGPSRTATAPAARWLACPGETWTRFACSCWEDLNRRPSDGATLTSRTAETTTAPAGTSCTFTDLLVIPAESGLSERRRGRVQLKLQIITAPL